MQNKIYMKKNLPQRNYWSNHIQLTIYEFDIKDAIINFRKKSKIASSLLKKDWTGRLLDYIIYKYLQYPFNQLGELI